MKPKRLRPGHIVQVTTLPPCDICLEHGRRPPRKARYDFRTMHGRWAHGCPTCYVYMRATSGTGIGKAQILITPEETLM